LVDPPRLARHAPEEHPEGMRRGNLPNFRISEVDQTRRAGVTPARLYFRLLPSRSGDGQQALHGGPILVGVVFRAFITPADPTIAAEAVAALLMIGTVAGIITATFLNNAGGAWDNAKKYIETGAYGGKRSDPHKAAVVGDTVGDPCKDTAGPSLHVLIKLLATITLVLAPLFL
jgi:hypothetical protein